MPADRPAKQLVPKSALYINNGQQSIPTKSHNDKARVQSRRISMEFATEQELVENANQKNKPNLVAE